MALWEDRPPYEQTDACENMTFLQLRLRAVTMKSWHTLHFASQLHQSLFFGRNGLISWSSDIGQLGSLWFGPNMFYLSGFLFLWDFQKRRNCELCAFSTLNISLTIAQLLTTFGIRCYHRDFTISFQITKEHGSIWFHWILRVKAIQKWKTACPIKHWLPRPVCQDCVSVCHCIA